MKAEEIMGLFAINRKCLFFVVVLFSVLCYLGVYFIQNATLQKVPFDRCIKPWTRAIVLTNSKHPSPDLLPCDWKPEAYKDMTRTVYYLDCNSFNDDGTIGNISSSTLIYKKVADSPDGTSMPSLTPKEIPCLKYFINEHCYGVGNTVPRVVHYIRFGAFNVSLDAFLSFYSTARFVQPCLILFHGDAIPSGPYWRALIHLLPNIVHVPMDRPREIFGRKINIVQHSSDVARMRILLEYGGIYADFDQLFLSSFDELLNKSTVVGKEFENLSINNALIVTKPHAEFLQIWLSQYTTFIDTQWAEHSTRLPHKLYKKYPHLVYLVDTFFRPHLYQMAKFYDRKKVPYHNWTAHYGLHLYSRYLAKNFLGAERIDKQDNAIGDAVRYILYGNQSTCLKPKARDKTNEEKRKKDEEKKRKDAEEKKKAKQKKNNKKKKGKSG